MTLTLEDLRRKKVIHDTDYVVLWRANDSLPFEEGLAKEIKVCYSVKPIKSLNPVSAGWYITL